MQCRWCRSTRPPTVARLASSDGQLVMHARRGQSCEHLCGLVADAPVKEKGGWAGGRKTEGRVQSLGRCHPKSNPFLPPPFDHGHHGLLQCVDCIWEYSRTHWPFWSTSIGNDVLFPLTHWPFFDVPGIFLPGMSPTGGLGKFSSTVVRVFHACRQGYCESLFFSFL
jgi:hypothetical protein